MTDTFVLFCCDIDQLRFLSMESTFVFVALQ